jgi:hypothetical protein
LKNLIASSSSTLTFLTAEDSDSRFTAMPVELYGLRRCRRRLPPSHIPEK